MLRGRPRRERGALDLAGLRGAFRTLADGFDARPLRRGGEAQPALLRVDPHAPEATALARIDPLRPRVNRLPKGDYPFLLGEIAAGASPYTRDEDSPPIGQQVFSMRKG